MLAVLLPASRSSSDGLRVSPQRRCCSTCEKRPVACSFPSWQKASVMNFEVGSFGLVDCIAFASATIQCCALEFLYAHRYSLLVGLLARSFCRASTSMAKTLTLDS